MLINNLHKLLRVQPPAQLKQEPFEGNDAYLRRLFRLRPGDKPNAGDIGEYIRHDLCYGTVQTDLFAYLLPFCLETWRDDLKGVTGQGGTVEYLYPVLANSELLNRSLSPAQQEIVFGYIREGILEEIDAQRGLTFRGSAARPHRWIGELTTYGVLQADLEILWRDWWNIESIGRAVSVVQYVSCLMYPENENPIFSPWTPNEGGGPPSLMLFEGHLYSHRWLEPNLEFLRRVLSPESIQAVLVRSVARLEGEPEEAMARLVGEDFPSTAETVRVHCNKMFETLASKDGSLLS